MMIWKTFIVEASSRRGLVATLRRKRLRCFSSSTNSETKYIDKWFESITKSQEFYETHAETTDEEKVRRYFYNIDLQGRLFLEETLPKNIASSIKDEKFLNFFFKRICLPNQDEKDFLKSIDVYQDYKFVSPCGREVNYIRPADTPIVFHSLTNDGNLLYGGNLKQNFDSSRLAVSSRTGRLYHELDGYSKGQPSSSDEEESDDIFLKYGLIRSSVAVALSENIHPGDDGEVGDDCNWIYTSTSGSSKLIYWLPNGAEPGESAWALPYLMEVD